MELILPGQDEDDALAASFDYSTLSAEVADQARAAADRIRSNFDQAREARNAMRACLVVIGGDLEAMKGLLGHANFGPWVRAELRWKLRQAENFMRAAKVFRANAHFIAHLPDTIVVELAYAPEPVREELLRRDQAGERLKVKTVKEAVKEAVKAAKQSPVPKLRAMGDYDEQVRREPEPAAPVPQAPVENPLLKDCGDILDLRGQVETLEREKQRLEARVAELELENAMKEDDLVAYERHIGVLEAENAKLLAKLKGLQVEPRLTIEPKPAKQKRSSRILYRVGRYAVVPFNKTRSEDQEKLPILYASWRVPGKRDPRYKSLETTDLAEAKRKVDAMHTADLAQAAAPAGPVEPELVEAS